MNSWQEAFDDEASFDDANFSISARVVVESNDGAVAFLFETEGPVEDSYLDDECQYFSDEEDIQVFSRRLCFEQLSLYPLSCASDDTPNCLLNFYVTYDNRYQVTHFGLACRDEYGRQTETARQAHLERIRTLLHISQLTGQPAMPW